MLENPWIPQPIKDGLTPKQAEFLCFDGREALYGGAAGGGKSVALLIAALQYIDEPGCNSLILRRTFKQLAKADSILNNSIEWLTNMRDAQGRKAHWSGSAAKWTFPSGNTLEFGHMDHEAAKFDYQGGRWAFIGVDEATQFTGPMLAYPRSRQRRPAGSKIPLRWRGASNPGGIGHTAIKERYIKDENGNDPSTPRRQFFPATIEDNPNLDREEYVKDLLDSGMDALTIGQLLKGDWDAVPGGRFQRVWFRSFDWKGDYIRLWNPDGTHKEPFRPMERKRFSIVDSASSISNAADFTVDSTFCVSPWGDLVWLDCDRFKAEIPEIVPRIGLSVKKWKPAFVGIEAIYSNVAVYQLACRSTDPVIPAMPLDKANRDKLVHATQAIVMASSGRVYLPTQQANPRFPREDILSELVRFTGDDEKDDHDDVVDTLSYAAELMNTIPSARQQGMPKVIGG